MTDRHPPEESAPTGQAAAPVRVPPWGALMFAQYRLLMGSGLLSSLGQQMREVVNLWVVFQLTGSALHLGFLGALRVVPLVVIGLFGGVLADIIDRRKILLFGKGVSFVLTSALAVLFVTDNLELWHVYATTLASTSASVLDGPARMALIHGSVPRTHMTNAITMSSVSFHGSVLLGPTLGGLVISFAGIGTAYVINAVFYVPAMAAVLLLRDVRPPQAGSRPRLRRADLLEGLRWVFKTPIVLAFATVDFAAIIFTSYKVLLPIFAANILGVGAAGLGFLYAAPAAGFLAGSVVLLTLGDVPRKGLAVVIGIIGYVAAIFVFAVSPWFVLSLIALAMSGAFDGVSANIRRTTVQLLVPDEIRGRATSVVQVFTRGTSSAGLMGTGAVAALVGPIAALIGGGAFALAVLAAVVLRWREILRVRI